MESDPESPVDYEVLMSVLNGPAVFPIEGGRSILHPGMTLGEVMVRVPNGERFRKFYIVQFHKKYGTSSN